MSRAAPIPGEARRLAPLRRETVQLASGLDVVVVERRALPVVDLQLVFKRGAEADAPGRAGRTSMSAEMLDEGTRSRSALEIAEQLDHLGAHLDVQAGWDSFTASLHVLSPRLERALDIFADVVSAATFPQREFARKSAERIGALRQEEDEAAVVAAKTLARSVFGDTHPYGAPLNGTVQSISALTVADVSGAYRTAFAADNACLIVVGDVDAAGIAAMLGDRLEAMPRSAQKTDSSLHAVPAGASRFLLVDKPGAAQAEVRVGFAGPPRSTADYFPLIVLNTVLGGSFTSRLNMILREKMGVTYGARSRFGFRRSGGLFSAGAAVFSAAAVRSAQVIIEEMRRLSEDLVPADELQRAQSYIALGMPRHFETTDDIAAHVREQLLYNLPSDYWQEYVERVLAVSAEDVRRAAARHLHSDASTVVVVADRREIEPLLEHTTWNNSIQLM